MFLYKMNPRSEDIVFDEPRSHPQGVMSQLLNELLSKLKINLLSPSSISGVYFYLESEDE